MTRTFLCRPEIAQSVFYGVSIPSSLAEKMEKARRDKAQFFYQKGLLFSEESATQASWMALGRAARLMPQEPRFNFAYALSCLRVKAPDLAFSRMESLWKQYDCRGAAFGCVSALFQKKEVLRAQTLMAEGLKNFAVKEDIWDFGVFLASQGEAYGAIGGFSLEGEVWLSGEGEVSLYLDGRQIKKIRLSGQTCQKISLPPSWRTSEQLRLRPQKGKILGGEINLSAVRRQRSLVWREKNRLYAWLEYPADPEFTAPPCVLRETSAVAMEKVPEGEARFYQNLGNPSLYSLPYTDKGRDYLEVVDDFGQALWGSPVPPAILPDTGPALFFARQGKPGLGRGFVVIMPVWGGKPLVQRALASLFKTLPQSEGGAVRAEIIVVNDASPEKSLADYLKKLSKARKITLIENQKQQGFAMSVNSAMERAQGRDVILFNSDAVGFGDWAIRLLRHLRKEKAGTATPFGNEAGQMSFPLKQDMPVSVRQAAALDQLCAKQFGPQQGAELLTGNGFCMAISAECLEETGGMREGIFAQAYGEEVDFCLRAAEKGFKHFAAPNLYLYHQGQGSIGGAGSALFLKNQEILRKLHPSFALNVWRFEQNTLLETFRWQLAEQCLLKKIAKKPSILMISHAIGGGVTRYISDHARDLKKSKKMPLLLVPTQEGCALGQVAETGKLAQDETTLFFKLPEEKFRFIGLLHRLAPQRAEIHHMIGHAPFIHRLCEDMGMKMDFFVHDHSVFCPHITLLNADGHYCGEPALPACQSCARAVAKKEGREPVLLADFLKENALRLQKAAHVYTPSKDSAQRLRRHFPEITPEVLIPEDDLLLFKEGLLNRQRRLKKNRALPWKIGIVGALSEWKGAEMLRKIAASSQKAGLKIKFTLIGHAINEAALEEAGVDIIGEFQEPELFELLSVCDLDAILLPSIAPETWGYAFSDVLKSGLFTFCFDIGSVAERIRRLGTQAGFIFPLGFPPERIGLFLAEKLEQLLP